MSEEKKELIKEVTKRINNLPENKQERVLGIMQGILLVHEEASQPDSNRAVE